MASRLYSRKAKREIHIPKIPFVVFSPLLFSLFNRGISVPITLKIIQISCLGFLLMLYIVPVNSVVANKELLTFASGVERTSWWCNKATVYIFGIKIHEIKPSSFS